MQCINEQIKVNVRNNYLNERKHKHRRITVHMQSFKIVFFYKRRLEPIIQSAITTKI